MDLALKQASLAATQGEIPVGAVITLQHRLIAKGHNQCEQLHDSSAHAELIAMTAASNYLGNKYLRDCCLYVTLEPCAMCAAAMYWTQLGRLVYAASDSKRGFSLYTPSLLHPHTTLEQHQPRAQEAQHLLKDFFQKLRTK